MWLLVGRQKAEAVSRERRRERPPCLPVCLSGYQSLSRDDVRTKKSTSSAIELFPLLLFSLSKLSVCLSLLQEGCSSSSIFLFPSPLSVFLAHSSLFVSSRCVGGRLHTRLSLSPLLRPCTVCLSFLGGVECPISAYVGFDTGEFSRRGREEERRNSDETRSPGDHSGSRGN